jgi:two-component system, cell cycle response regulator DivK
MDGQEAKRRLLPDCPVYFRLFSFFHRKRILFMSTEAYQKGQKHILIVDDNEDMRLLLQEILEEEGIYRLSFATTGPEALAQATLLLPDLLLMDMSLPELSGWEVVSQLRRQPAFAHVPIIAVTAHVSLKDQERARSVGCDAHLGKPFDVTTVLEIVEHFLALEQSA